MCSNTSNSKIYGEKLAERTARRNGHGGIISIPGECIGIRYERYIDRESGIITLIPAKSSTRVETPGGLMLEEDDILLTMHITPIASTDTLST